MKVTSKRMMVAVWTLAAMMMVVPLSSVSAEDEVVLKVGDAAPEFSLPGSDGQTYSLAQFKGKQEVVLAFFFKAFTPG